MTDTKVDSPAQAKTVYQTAYQPKRLRRGKKIDIGIISPLLTYLSSIKENDRISYAFRTLFDNTNASLVRFTERSAFDGDNPEDFLFSSEVALIFYDLVVGLNLEDNLDEVFEKLEPNKGKSLSNLSKLMNRVSGIARKTILNESEEQTLGKIFSDSNIRTIAGFFLAFFDQEPITEEETAEQKEEEDAKTDQATQDKNKPATTAGVPQVKEGGGGETTEQPSAATSSTDSKETITTADFIDPTVQRETARFATISLIQLEQFHGLPEGSLQNSPQLRAVITQKVQGFFGTTLPKDRFQKLLDDPTERLKLVREFQWLLLKDRATQTSLVKSFANIAGEDKNLQAALEEKIAAAQRGEGVSELIKGIAENPEFKKVISNLQQANPLFQEAPEIVRTEISRELMQQLADLNLHGEKLLLAHENILNTLNTLIDGYYPLEVINQLSQEHFQILFSKDVPYNDRLIAYLKEKAWPTLRSMKGRENGDVLWNADQHFALDEATKYLNEKNPGVTAKQAQTVFRVAIADPIDNRRFQLKEAFRAGASEESLIELQRELINKHLQIEWERFIQDQEKIRAFAQYAGFDNTTMEYILQVRIPPSEFQTFSLTDNFQHYTQTATDFSSDYMPDNALAMSPMAGSGNFVNRARGFRNIKNFANKLNGRLGNKATEEAVGKIAQAGGSALPGGPLTGWVLKQAATKKGRRKLAILGTGGALAFLTPLFAGGWFTRLLTGVGTVAGWIFGGGPLGAFLTGLSAGWLGLAAETWWNNLFNGNNISATYQGPTLGSLGGGGTIPPSPGVTAASLGGTASQAAASTGVQAVVATVGVVAVTSIFSNFIMTSALLADFPQVDPLGAFTPGGQGRASEYLTIEKRVFITGCPNNHCENPDFPEPVRAEYSIVIKTKGDYSVTLKEVSDTLRVAHSDQAWEEEGKTPPNIPERIKGFDISPKIYEDQTIGPGEIIEFSYTESFNEDYNHAMISNNLDMTFDYSNGASSGNDQVITGEVIFIGDYSQGAGCWPTNGHISQLPNGVGETSKKPSHTNVDAFDIASSPQPEGFSVFTPFAGNLCFGVKDPGYGNHLKLTVEDGPFKGTYIFGHFRDMILETKGECQEVPAGAKIGHMGNTGNSTGPHLHFEKEGNQHTPSVLGSFMPGGLATKLNDIIRTCYIE